MNFNEFKLDFIAFLREKYFYDNSETSFLDEDISIFNYKQDFKRYLGEKTDINTSSSIFDLESLNSCNFIDGQFYDNSNDINDGGNSIILGLLNDILKQEEYFEEIDIDKSSDIDKNEALNFILKKTEDDDLSENLSIDNMLEFSSEQSSNVFLNLGNQYNKLLSSKDIGTISYIFDSNNDGLISEDENQNAISFLSVLDGIENDFSIEDITVIKEYISNMISNGLSTEQIKESIWNLGGKKDELSKFDFQELSKIISNTDISFLPEAIQEGIKPNVVMENNGAGENYNQSSGTSGRNVSSPAFLEANINNMSIQELESELTNAQQEVSNLKNDYLTELEKVDKELADKINENNEKILLKEEELNAANTQLEDLNTQIESDSTKLKTAQNRVCDIDCDISELRQLLNEPECNSSEIKSKISQLINEKNEINNETIPSLEENIRNNQEEVNRLKSDVIPNLESDLESLNVEAEKYQEELINLSDSSDGLSIKFQKYNEAIQYVDSIKSILQSRKLSQENAKNIDMPDKSEAPLNYKDLDGYTFKNLPLSYSLDGQDYHCVNISGYDLNQDGEIDFKPDSWEELQRYFANGGVANIGKYGSMQCHNYSDLLGQFVLGDANLEVVKALYDETNIPEFGDQDIAGKMGTSREWNPRRFAQCKASDRDEERAIIENELQNGRPCLVSVPYVGGQHYAVAVGLSNSGDILIWDSYNGSMEKLGKSSNSDSSKLHRNLATGNGVMVFCDGYSYSYSKSKLIDYWSYVGNSPEYVLENGYK